MVNLERDRFPPTGRSRGQRTGGAVGNHPEMRLEIRNQLLEDRVAIRSVIRRVHGVRVIEVRRRMLERHRDHSRESGPVPLSIERETRLEIVALEHRRQRRRRWLAVGREPEWWTEAEVSLFVHGGIVRVRM